MHRTNWGCQSRFWEFPNLAAPILKSFPTEGSSALGLSGQDIPIPVGISQCFTFRYSWEQELEHVFPSSLQVQSKGGPLATVSPWTCKCSLGFINAYGMCCEKALVRRTVTGCFISWSLALASENWWDGLIASQTEVTVESGFPKACLN